MPDNVVVKIVTDDKVGKKETILNGYEVPEFNQEFKKLNENEFLLERIKMKILAIDFGNKMGFSGLNQNKIVSGTINHKNTKDLAGHQYLHFRYWLNSFIGNFLPDVIYYEDVRRHLGTDAAHVYGGYLATLQAFCCEKNIKLVPVAVGTIKKHWTGKGNANKYEMIQEARKRGFQPIDDNEADALAILDYAKTHVNK